MPMTPFPERDVPMADVTNELLKAQLRQLRLPTMGREFEKLARDAAATNQTFAQFLLRLTELELTTRAANAVTTRIKDAGFPVEKDFDTSPQNIATCVRKPFFVKTLSYQGLETGRRILDREGMFVFSRHSYMLRNMLSAKHLRRDEFTAHHMAHVQRGAPWNPRSLDCSSSRRTARICSSMVASVRWG